MGKIWISLSWNGQIILQFRYVLETSKKIWDKGHPLLAALANNAWNIKDDKSLIKLFGNKYFADSAHYHSRGITWSEWYDKKNSNLYYKKR